MNLPMFTWSCVVALIKVFMLFKVVLFVWAKSVENRLFELGHEHDEFYVPGDRLEDEA